MAMYFHLGNKETILFSFWRTQTTLAMLLSCLLVFIVAVLYEALKFYREWLKRPKRQEGGGDRRSNHDTRAKRPTRDIIGHLELIRHPATPAESSAGRERQMPWLSPMHWFQTLLHMLQVAISFMLMLIFMTFNVWLCTAVVLGAGLGYFIFFARNSGTVDNHCL
ncbi:hypothetical protein KR222_003383 [Zaprionus bogoriensis]|nr:hypothetical protein KR222_003383 [Zaprionus bogoriensis]